MIMTRLTKKLETVTKCLSALKLGIFKEDLTLIVEGRKLHVSKAVLATLSPVFDRYV